MTTILTHNDQDYLVHSETPEAFLAYPLTNRIAKMELVELDGDLTSREVTYTIYGRANDKLHMWDEENKTFVAVSLKAYDKVFQELNSVGDSSAKVAELQRQNAALQSELRTIRNTLQGLKQALA